MGQKLGSFLRVLASGLSPQAFQANVGMYQQEQAEQSRIEAEGRAEESAIKQMGVKQAFANLGVLSVAAKKANEEGDTEQSHKIGLAAKEIFDKIDPRYRGMAMDSFMTQTMAPSEAGKGKARTVIHAGERKAAVENERGQLVDPVSGKYLEGAVIAPSRQETGGAGAFSKKTQGKIEDTLMKTSDNLARLKEIKRTFKDEYLTWKTQIGEGIKKYGEKAGMMQLSKADRAKTGQYEKFRRKTFSFLNEYIHDMSGAAVSVQEAKRLTKALQTMQDSPTGFEAKLEDVMQEMEAKQARYEYWAKNGLVNKDTEDKDLRALEAEFPQEAFEGMNKAKEAVARSKDPEAKQKALAKLQQWFEVNGYDTRMLESF